MNETINYKCFLKDAQDKQSRNLERYITQNTNFYNGKQYEDVNVTNMVRTSLNICQMMVNTKASNIVGTPRFFTFTSDDGNFNCTKLERFDEYNRKKMNEDVEDYTTVKNGFITGTAIDFYRWDEDNTAYAGIFKGGLVREHIDPLRFAVADPNIPSIQKQKWVMFWRNEEIGAVREMVEGKNDKEIEEKQELIVPDDYSQNKNKYLKNPDAMTYELVTVYTRFFRINGEVFFTCSTKEVDLFEYPHALNPSVNVAVAKEIQKELDKKLDEDGTSDKFIDYEMDFSDVVSQVTDRHKLTEEEYLKIKSKFSLYPFSVFTPLPLNNSFYGNSDVSAIIPVQRGINFNLSMTLKCVENAAYNKIFVKEGALAGQQITNEPGQVITDFTRNTNGWGIKLAESQPVPNQLLTQTRDLIDLVRTVYGFSDVMDGTISNQDVSGYALQLMMKQSKTTLEQIQKIFWNFCKDNAQIRVMFYKHFVDKAKYLWEKSDIQLQKDMEAQRKLLEMQQTDGLSIDIPEDELKKQVSKYATYEFSGEEIKNILFDIDLNVEVMQGTVDSKIAEAQIWDTLIMNGGIQNLEPQMLELFMEANPIVTPRSKAVLKEVLERQKESKINQLEVALQKATMQIEQLMQYGTNLKGQLDFMSNYNKNLTNEFKNKIGVANQINKQQQSLINKMKSPGEVKSNNSMGIEGGQIAPTEPII